MKRVIFANFQSLKNLIKNHLYLFLSTILPIVCSLQIHFSFSSGTWPVKTVWGWIMKNYQDPLSDAKVFIFALWNITSNGTFLFIFFFSFPFLLKILSLVTGVSVASLDILATEVPTTPRSAQGGRLEFQLPLGEFQIFHLELFSFIKNL